MSHFAIQGNHVGSVFAGQTTAQTAYGVDIGSSTTTGSTNDTINSSKTKTQARTKTKADVNTITNVAFVVTGNTLTGNLLGGLRDGSASNNTVIANNIVRS